MSFRDRIDAGQRLAKALRPYAGRSDVIILALPRGGVPVAAEVAQELGLPMDLMLVRKLGLPGHRELAMGAIAQGGIKVLNESVLNFSDVSEHALDEVTREEQEELNRRTKLYRGDHPNPDLNQKTVILIDDGVATGATMKAAIQATQKSGAHETIVAVPVAAAESYAELEAEADAVVCLSTPHPFFGVGQWYDDFSQTSDEEVQDLLKPFLKYQA